MNSRATISTATIVLVLGFATNALTDELDLRPNIRTAEEAENYGKSHMEEELKRLMAEHEANEQKALNDTTSAEELSIIGLLSELKGKVSELTKTPFCQQLTAKFKQALNYLSPVFNSVPVLIYMRLSAVACPLLFFATLHYRNRD